MWVLKARNWFRCSRKWVWISVVWFCLRWDWFLGIVSCRIGKVDHQALTWRQNNRLCRHVFFCLGQHSYNSTFAGSSKATRILPYARHFVFQANKNSALRRSPQQAIFPFSCFPNSIHSSTPSQTPPHWWSGGVLTITSLPMCGNSPLHLDACTC